MATSRSTASSTSSLRVCETFVSLSGETTRQGLPAFFVRLAGCNLRCDWCDTAYAWGDGAPRTLDDLVGEVGASGLDLVILTGGEPLMQPAAFELVRRLADAGRTVLVETNGTFAVAELDPRAVRILDVKPPSARAAEPFLLANLDHLRRTDELKFVVADRADWDFARDFVGNHGLAGRCRLLASPVAGRVDAAEVAEWVIAARGTFRFQLQLHKILWGENARGR